MCAIDLLLRCVSAQFARGLSIFIRRYEVILFLGPSQEGRRPLRSFVDEALELLWPVLSALVAGLPVEGFEVEGNLNFCACAPQSSAAQTHDLLAVACVFFRQQVHLRRLRFACGKSSHHSLIGDPRGFRFCGICLRAVVGR